MKQYDRNKILNTFPMLNSFNKSNGLAWRIVTILFSALTRMFPKPTFAP